ncbi:MAG: glycosyltransferase family protein [Candidatus Geothermincolia bacterium]
MIGMIVGLTIIAAVLCFELPPALGALRALRHSRGLAKWDRREDYQRLLSSDFTPPLSFLSFAPEDGHLAEWLDRLLSLRFPRYEVILIINSGSVTDVGALASSFFLKRVDLRYRKTLAAPVPLAVYRSEDGRITLAECDTEAWGAAINCGLDLARYPLVCLLEEGALPHPPGLARLVKLFMETRHPVLRAAGLARPCNRRDLEGLSFRDESLPEGGALRLYLAERFRTLLALEGGMRRLRAFPAAPAALSVYRRSDLMRLGGFSASDGREFAEAELSVRAYSEQRNSHNFFLPGPAAATHYPERFPAQVSRLTRESEGASAALRAHGSELRDNRASEWDARFLTLAPRLGPLVELLGWLVLLPAAAIQLADPRLFGIFLLSSVALPALASIFSVIAVQDSFPLFPNAGLPLALYAILSCFGYRQVLGLAMLRRTSRPPRRESVHA